MHPGQAVDAGFRACKRCSPDTFDPRIASVVEVCRLIDEYSGGALELADLAAATGLSATHLQKTFKSLLGVTPTQYGAMVRRRGFEQLCPTRDIVNTLDRAHGEHFFLLLV